MAADIIVFDPPTDEESDICNNPSTLEPRKDSDSESGSDFEPLVKKTRATKPRAPLEDVSNDLPSVSIYTKQVTGLFNRKPLTITDIDIQDIEDDDEEVLTKKTKKTRPDRKGKVSRTPEPEVYEVDDEETPDNSVGSPKSNRDRSPTPPPSLPKNVPIARRRQRRTPKATKQAIGKLDSLRVRLEKEKTISQHQDEAEDDDIIIMDNDMPSPEKKLLVKVKSIHGIQRIPMTRKESFERVLKELAEKEGVEMNQLVVYHKDHRIEPYDSVGSLRITVADILECHTVREMTDDEEESDDESLDDIDDPTMIRLKLRSREKRAVPVTLKIMRTDPLEKLMRMYAAKCKMSFDSLNFFFDGEPLRRRESAESLEMEDDDCIDVTVTES